MMDKIVLISNIVTGSLRMVSALLLIHRMLSAGKPEKRSNFFGIAGGTAIAICGYFLPLSAIYELGLEAVAIAFLASRFQKADTRMSLFISIFYEIAIAFWQFLISAGLGIVFRSEKFLTTDNYRGLAAVWLTHLIVAVIAYIIIKCPPMEKKDGFRISSLVALVGFMAVITLSEQSVLAIADDVITMWMILAMILLVAVLVFHMNRQYEMEKEVAQLKSEQAELLERDYTELNRAYSVNAKLFHDFHNHIGAIRQLLAQEKYDKAQQYLDELQEPIQEITGVVWTGDETVDYLINSKAAIAAKEQIKFQAEVEFPRHTNLKRADLCAILGNLLDNALEAARKVKEPERKSIKLTIRRINQMLIIKVENFFVEPLSVDNDGLKTTKTEAGLHGWGLKSAQTAAEKYNGMVKTTCEGDVFRAVATLSYDVVSVEAKRIS